jgi:hypothetical protein
MAVRGAPLGGLIVFQLQFVGQTPPHPCLEFVTSLTTAPVSIFLCRGIGTAWDAAESNRLDWTGLSSLHTCRVETLALCCPLLNVCRGIPPSSIIISRPLCRVWTTANLRNNQHLESEDDDDSRVDRVATLQCKRQWPAQGSHAEKMYRMDVSRR